MKLIASNQEKIQFRFVTNHYDYHITGSCVFNNKLCFFKLSNDPWDGKYNEETEEFIQSDPEPKYNIYEITWSEKLNLLTHQILFELLVSNHWTYKPGQLTRNVTPPKPWSKWYFRYVKTILPETPDVHK